MLSEAAHFGVDLRYVHGQQAAKWPLEVARAGGHNILFIGPPGAGKTIPLRAEPAGLLQPKSVAAGLVGIDGDGDGTNGLFA